MRNYLPELIALPLLPLLLLQGRRTRRITPRLPEAGGATSGMVDNGSAREPLKLLTFGESPVAGVGVRTHHEGITGCLATALAAQLQRPVAWQACGKNGATVREAMSLLPLVPPEPVDLALVAFGVNDTTAFRPVRQWRSDMRGLLDSLEARCRPALILVSGVPPIGLFPALPQPLRAVLGVKASALDRALTELAESRARTLHVPLRLDTRDPTLMAHDGYHPSAAGCLAWAGILAEAYRGTFARAA